jgi:D-ribose pyranase
MKKTMLINSQISRIIAKMGHFDTLTIGDAGLPIPNGPERIDLALMKGIPAFLDVLRCVLTELEVQRVFIASEMQQKNLPLYEQMTQIFADIEIIKVPHEAFKSLTKESKAVVRTGECLPYANIILESGVTF